MLYIGSSVSEDCRNTLKKLNIPFSVMPDNPALPYPLCTHPDTSAIGIGGRLFSSGDIAAFLGCTDTGEALSKAYPDDILFNGFCTCNRLFCLEKHFSKHVTSYAREIGMEIMPVRQGYAKCSTVVLGDVGIITADPSIAKAARGICRVLKIMQGGISLEPYDYGFIGGASFVIGSTVYFFGNIERHKNGKEILSFIKECGFEAVSLSDGMLCDAGGGIYVEE